MAYRRRRRFGSRRRVRRSRRVRPLRVGVRF